MTRGYFWLISICFIHENKMETRLIGLQKFTRCSTFVPLLLAVPSQEIEGAGRYRRHRWAGGRFRRGRLPAGEGGEVSGHREAVWFLHQPPEGARRRPIAAARHFRQPTQHPEPVFGPLEYDQQGRLGAGDGPVHSRRQCGDQFTAGERFSDRFGWEDLVIQKHSIR